MLRPLKNIYLYGGDYAKEISKSTLEGTEKMAMGTELMNFFDRDLKGSLTRVDQALNCFAPRAR